MRRRCVSRYAARVRLASLALCLALLVPAPAGAVEGTEIASSFDEGNPFDLFLGVSYGFMAKRAAIKREMSGAVIDTTPPGAVPVVRDLVFSEDRHVLTPHAELGIFHDLSLSFALPITLGLSRSYEFDQRASPCIFPGSGEDPTCINKTNSSTLIDKILPDGTAGAPLGYDAGDPTTGFPLDSTTVFKSVGRSGLDTVNLGISWAPMNQDRDDTKPTWVLTAEFRLSVGKIMRFNRLDPETETGVSRGVHEFYAETVVSKRTRWAEPFVYFWWQAPLGVRGNRANDPNGSLYWDVGFGQRTAKPQQHAGTLFGFEAIVYNKPESDERVNLEVSGRIDAHFNGVGYSEIWEVLALGGDIENNPNAPLAIDLDPTRTDDTKVNHPGTSVIENYLSFGARVGVNAHVGRYARFGATFELGRDQTHALTYDDAGRELPGCGTEPMGQECETPDDPVVSANTKEVNPLHKQLVDVAGRRYLIDEMTTFTVLVNGMLVF